jgi:hypothetical protein
MGGYTVITTMKNEGAFLLEWVAHHKALGFDSLLICTNDCGDPTTRMALRLEAMGLARHHATKPWAATSIQRSALKQARRYPEVTGADWIYVCDADEFLVVKTGDGTAQALTSAARPEAEVISVPWRIFGPSGRTRYEDRPVTQLFTDAMPAPHRHPIPSIYAKSLFRNLDQVHRIGIHAPVQRPDAGRDLLREGPGGAPRRKGLNPMLAQAEYSVAQINHYALRALDSFLVKRDRGRVNHADEVMDYDYWKRFDVGGAQCDAIRRMDGPVAEWLAHLRADPVLDRLHRRAVRWHGNRAAALRRLPDYQRLIAMIEAGGPTP